MKNHIKSMFKGVFVLAAALTGAIGVESAAFANATVSGYSGKAFSPADASCFTPNAGWAQNSCATSKIWALYPLTSSQFTTSNQVIIYEYSPGALVSCRLDITSTGGGYAYQSGPKSPAAAGPGFIDFSTPPPPLAVNNAAEVACSLPPNGQIRQMSVY